MDNFVLQNGVEIPSIGLGTWENRDENPLQTLFLRHLKSVIAISTLQLYMPTKSLLVKPSKMQA